MNSKEDKVYFIKRRQQTLNILNPSDSGIDSQVGHMICMGL